MRLSPGVKNATDLLYYFLANGAFLNVFKNLKNIKMKMFIYSLILIVLFCYLSELEIQFKPFHIRLNNLALGLAWMFLLVSVICFQVSGFNKGESAGYKDAFDDIRKELKK